jgi:large subunit ribosomal protein L31
MKAATHPVYKETIIPCACGNTIETRATRENIKLDVCSSCHPFFTGRQKLLDAEGRVERFMNKYGKKKK